MNFHLEQLLTQPQISQKTTKELASFLHNHPQYHLVFVYGYASPKPQSTDLCVIVNELLAYFPQISATILTEDTEDEYRKWAQIQARPSLALMYGLHQCEKMTKLFLWQQYIQKINQAMAYDTKQFKKLSMI